MNGWWRSKKSWKMNLFSILLRKREENNFNSALCISIYKFCLIFREGFIRKKKKLWNFTSLVLPPPPPQKKTLKVFLLHDPKRKIHPWKLKKLSKKSIFSIMVRGYPYPLSQKMKAFYLTPNISAKSLSNLTTKGSFWIFMTRWGELSLVARFD